MIFKGMTTRFRNISFYALILGVFVLSGALATFLSSASIATDSPILQIRKEYQSIRNALSTFKEETVELSGYSTEGGVAKAYRDSKGYIRLIRAERCFESGKLNEEYYYQKGGLIFVFYEYHRYNVPFNVTPEVAKEIGSEPFDPRKTRIREERYYFNTGKMIRWLDEEKKEVDVKSKDFKEAEKEIMNFSNELIGKFKH